MPPMPAKQVPVALPEELVELIGGEKQAQQELILSLLRRERISTGKAAELLGLSMWDLVDLMHAEGIPVITQGPGSKEEIEKTLRRIGKKSESARL